MNLYQLKVDVGMLTLRQSKREDMIKERVYMPCLHKTRLHEAMPFHNRKCNASQ